MERDEYDVYGAVTIFDSSGNPLTASAIGNPYLFTGRRYDPESGNYYYRARIYSPTLGRFLQMDPLGYLDGLNLYTYVGNNPASWVDPWGTYVESFGMHPREMIYAPAGLPPLAPGIVPGSYGGGVRFPIDALLKGIAGIGVIGLLDALLSEIVGDEEEPSPSSTSEDENEICSNNADPGNTGRPDGTDKVYEIVEQTQEELKEIRTRSTWRIGNRSVKDVVGDATVILDGVPIEVKPGIQGDVDRVYVERYARAMMTKDAFNWNRMMLHNEPDPVIFAHHPDGYLVSSAIWEAPCIVR